MGLSAMRPVEPALMPANQGRSLPGVPLRCCRSDAGSVSPAWRHGLFVAVLSAHVLALAAGHYSEVFDKGGNEPPGVLQVSWIDAARPEPPADPEPSVQPIPLPMKPRPAPTVRPKPKPKPVLAVAAEAPSPVGHDPVAQPDPTDEPGKPEESANLPKGPAADSATQAGVVLAPSAPSFDADYLSNPAPEYPAMSRMLHEQGRVVLRIQVTADGEPEAVLVSQSSGFERLDQAAIEAVWRWRFVPARQYGKDVAGWVIVPLRFSLRS
jgi:protein TonB